MNLKEWAKNEIEIAKQILPSKDEAIKTSFTPECFDLAEECFNLVCDKQLTGFKWSATKNIFDRLMLQKTLSPVNDDEGWIEYEEVTSGVKVFFHKRLPALFKNVYENGATKFVDTGRICYLATPEGVYGFPFVTMVVDLYCPIEFPYVPEEKPFVVFGEKFLIDESHGDFDTLKLDFLITPKFKKIEINKYFSLEDKVEEISKEEYEERKSRRITKK